MEKIYTVTVEIGDDGSDEEKAQLLANMIARIEAENSLLGQATCRVTSVSEVEEE